MTPTSEQLEAFFERLKSLNRDLAKLKGAEVKKSETIAAIKGIFKEWLRFSEGLRNVETLPKENLDAIDGPLKEMLEGTNSRTRSSAYQKKLAPVISCFTDKVVVPVIRHEGSPTQVASRQLLSEFAGSVSSEEQAYLEEAARCLAAHCNRAAIIMLWAAAMARFHSAVEKIGFNAYNVALDQALQKKGSPFNRLSKTTISSLPELQRSRDFELLVIGMTIWKYDLQIFDELDRLLGLRNSAAHPGMLKPNAFDVQQYASKIATYVFSVVPR